MKEVVPGRAAYKSGRIQPGDEVVGINSRPVKVPSRVSLGARKRGSHEIARALSLVQRANAACADPICPRIHIHISVHLKGSARDLRDG